MNKKLKDAITLFSIAVAGSAIYILPYIKYVFYEQQIEVMGMTNAQSGLLMTVYAATAIILFPLGGALSDKIATKKCMMASLLATIVLTIAYAMTLSYTAGLIIWALLAISTGTVWWPSVVKAIATVGDPNDSGKVYGIYYACNGIIGSLINSLALWFSTKADTTREGFIMAIAVSGVFTMIGAIMIFFFFHDKKKNDCTVTDSNEKIEPESEFKFSDIGKVLRNPYTWVLAIIMFTSYSLYSSTSYFNPYLIDVAGISTETSGIFSIIRTYVLIVIGGPIGGWLCDKVVKTTARWLMISFVLTGLLIVGVMMIPSNASSTFASIYTLLPAAVTMAQYGVVWSIQREIKIPAIVMGTAIGIASCISWLPDLFMHAMFGHWMDVYGNGGYTYIFIYLTFIAVLGFAAGFIVQYSNRDKNKLKVNQKEA